MKANPRISFSAAALLTMMLSAPASCQTRFRVATQIVGGLYAFNSENGSLILEGHKLRSQYGLDLSFGYYPVQKLRWTADLEYLRSNVHTLEFNDTFGGGPYPVTSFAGQVSLDQFSADLGPRFPFASWLQLGLGPSFAMVRRITEIPYVNIFDRLNSYCLGLHGVATAIVPFSKSASNGFYWYYTLKLRYLHSLFFDARGRDLAGYSQSFLTASLAAGIGYAF